MGVKKGVGRGRVKDKGLGGSDTGTGDGGNTRQQAMHNGGKDFIMWGIGVYGAIPRGLGKLPWGSKHWGIVLGHLRGLAGTFLNLGTLTVVRGTWGGRGRVIALPLPPG